MVRPMSSPVISMLALGLLASTAGIASSPQPDRELRGPYLGQTPPGRTPEKFARGVVSVPGPDAVPRFTPDGDAVYWSHIGPGGGILHSRQANGRWMAPERVSLGEGGIDVLPFLFDGGRKMFFLSTRPLPDGRRPSKGFFTFWIAGRKSDGWSAPSPIAAGATAWDDISAIAEDGTLYLGSGQETRVIFRVVSGDSSYSERTAVGPAYTGLPAMVGPGERYFIFSSKRENGYGATDLYIAFRKPDGSWDQPINMGPAINTSHIEHFASLTPDGKYLFFGSDRDGDMDVYWMDASIIEELRLHQMPPAQNAAVCRQYSVRL